MKSWIKMLLELVLSLFFVTFATFFLMNLSPSGPAEAYAERKSPIVTEKQVDAVRHQLGMDRPILVQYLNWIERALRLDLGDSLVSGKPVRLIMKSAVGVTLGVMVFSALFMGVTALLAAILLNVSRHKIITHCLELFTVVSISVPHFYIAIVLIDYLALNKGIMKVAGNTGVMKFIPCALCIGLSGGFYFGRILGDSLKRIMSMDFCTFAESRGLSRLSVLWHHGLVNAISPLIPVFLQCLALNIASIAILEQIFSIKGVGFLILNATLKRDAPILYACILFLGFVIVTVDIIADKIRRYQTDSRGGD